MNVLFLTIEARGEIDNKVKIKSLQLSTFSDYHTTAMFTAALAKISSKTNTGGVVFPYEMTNLDEVLKLFRSSKVKLKEFTSDE